LSALSFPFVSFFTHCSIVLSSSAPCIFFISYDNIQDYTEALLIEFDPTVVSYKDILELWRSQHTPYPNKRQYRSALLYVNESQKAVAQEFAKNEKYVDVEPVTKFYMAEEYHQNYLKKMTSRVFY